MLTLRKHDERGRANHGWLDSHHTFSFGNYYDPAHMHFRKLRVINDDRVMPGSGFATHPHEDMEIISYVVEGAIEHKDSMGNTSVLRRGEVQRMSAGTGLTHSEYNHSDSDLLRFLQIWVLPAEKGLTPEYRQTNYFERLRPDELCLLVSADGRDGSVLIHQDLNLYTAHMTENGAMEYPIPDGRYIWLQLVNGAITVNGQVMQEGDGLAVKDENRLMIRSQGTAELLLFDLA